MRNIGRPYKDKVGQPLIGAWVSIWPMLFYLISEVSR